ncbi:hypothetical protein DMB66_06860 [Actinoplanes sp. ATCC 53533]|uniref:hypothetical protein n=1 Tax=Actinoplanes sp. ATCC 53533 TaxID=1288362 RepID=UPI000F7760B1|nr:hypothetical protein [Actinoplanes sp. ATCC 53533]RSM72296.1 hypothetical protein DMB66_06860 [Actinoplanes sp. ATCC 53533]
MKRIIGSAAALLVVVGSLVLAAQQPAAAAPNCPLGYGHEPYEGDVMRQPNNAAAIRAQKNRGAKAVEGDLRFTSGYTKAVMWHNKSTWGLNYSGSAQDIHSVSWTYLKSLKIKPGQDFSDQGVMTFWAWVSEIKAQGLDGLVELKEVPGNFVEIAKPLAKLGMADRIKFYSTGADNTNATNAINALKNAIGKEYWDSVDGRNYQMPWVATQVGQEGPNTWWANSASAWESTFANGRPVVTNSIESYKTWTNGKCNW